MPKTNFDTIYRLVTAGWPDRQTHDDSIYCANIPLRGKNERTKV